MYNASGFVEADDYGPISLVLQANAVLTGCFSGSSQQQVQNVLANTSLFQRLLKDQQSTDKQE